MAVIEKCESCGVPLFISRELSWKDNGVIAVANSPENRMVFYESNVIDNLFRGIEDLIGVSIEHIVIESRRRETRRFLERSFPFEVRNALLLSDQDMRKDGSHFSEAIGEKIRSTGKELVTRVLNVSRIFGYGDSRLGDGWEKGEPNPHRSNKIHDPYSLPLWVADTIGAVEAFEGMDMKADYRETGDNTYRVSVFPGAHPVELKGKLKRKKHYAFKPGSTHLERCEECGAPAALSRYEWDVDRGTITEEDTGRRMAVLGPDAVEAIFDDLEVQHGESVPEAIIEAQRRYVKSRAKEEDLRKGGRVYGEMSALRGLGNITGYKVDKTSLTVNIENACLHLMIVGMTQALFEMAMELRSSSYDWDLSRDGDLRISITA